MARRRFHRVRHHAATAMRGGKGTAVAALTGAVTAFAIGKLAANVEFVRSNWYAPPAVLIGVGHFLKRKNLNVGTAVISAGGAVGYYGYALSSQAKGADAMPIGPGDAGAMQDAGAFAVDAYANVSQLGAANGLTDASNDYQYEEALGLQG